MRTTTAGAGASLLVTLLLVTGCGAGDDTAAPADSGESSLAPADPSETPGGGSGESGGSRRAVCGEVVAGIADFNRGDFPGTVGHFEDAVPLAKAELEDAGDDDAEAAADLLEAVQYYADLAPADYPEASLGSTEFQRYKAITLGQCVAEGQAPGVPDPSSGEGGVEA